MGNAGCGKPEAAGIPRERFVRIYAEMLFLAETHRNDSRAFAAGRDSLYRAWGVDSSLMRKTLEMISSDPKEIALLYEQTIMRLERRAADLAARDSAAAVRASRIAAGDSVPAGPSLRGKSGRANARRQPSP